VSNDEATEEHARAVRLGRRQRTLYRCNRMFFQARSEQELLQAICQILVSGDELRLAWIGYCEDDAEKTLRPVARAGHGVDFLKPNFNSFSVSSAASAMQVFDLA
jgi:hypothetical protein